MNAKAPFKRELTLLALVAVAVLVASALLRPNPDHCSGKQPYPEWERRMVANACAADAAKVSKATISR